MEVIHAANVAIDIVVGSVRNLGLEVMLQKTEAIFVYERRKIGAIASSGSPVEITVGQMGLQMKYLGLTFNGLWALTSSDWLPDWAGWLMPWLASCPTFTALVRQRGRDTCVLAALLYGAPVWDREVARDARIHQCINRVQRCLVLRISRAYKTMSHAAAMSPRECSSHGSLGTTIIVDWRPFVCGESIRLPRH